MNIAQVLPRGTVPTAGIVGYGRFGSLLHRILEDDFSVACYDISIPEMATSTHLTRASAADIVFLCVPIVEFERCLEQVAPCCVPAH